MISQVLVSTTRSRGNTNQYLIWLPKIQTRNGKFSIGHIFHLQCLASGSYALGFEEKSIPSGIVENLQVDYFRLFNCKQKPLHIIAQCFSLWMATNSWFVHKWSRGKFFKSWSMRTHKIDISIHKLDLSLFLFSCIKTRPILTQKITAAGQPTSTCSLKFFYASYVILFLTNLPTWSYRQNYCSSNKHSR